MADIPAFRIKQVVNGGPAEGGQEVAFDLALEGTSNLTLRLFLSHDEVPQLITALLTFSGMARLRRLGKNPDEDREGAVSGGHALLVAGAYPSMSINDPGTGILVLKIATPNGEMHSPLAVRPDQIHGLLHEVQRLADLMSAPNDNPKPPTALN